MSGLKTFYSMLAAQAAPSQPMVLKVKTDNAGVSASNQFTLPTFGSGFNYSVDWGDGSSSGPHTESTTKTYASAGEYVLTITGALLPRLYFVGVTDRQKLLEIMQWGGNAWTSMASAFSGCTNLKVTATNAPNLTGCTSLQSAFQSCPNLGASTTDFSLWNTATVTDMSSMFAFGNANPAVENWNTAAVTNMGNLFRGNASVNRNLGNWNVSSVTNVSLMLYGCTAMSRDNYDALLIGWASRPVVTGRTADWLGLKYSSAAVSARAVLTGAPNNWVITGDTLQ